MAINRYVLALGVMAFGVGSAHAQRMSSLREVFGEPLQKNKGPIYVAPFHGPGKKSTQLGTWAAAYVADELQKSLQVTFVAPQNLQRAIKNTLVLRATLSSHAGIAAWVGKEAGAAVVFVGTVNFVENKIEIMTLAVETSSYKVLASATLKLAQEESLMPLAQQSTAVEDGLVAGNDGISFAGCSSCPRPTYTPNAYAAKAQGLVILQVLVNTEGRAEKIQLTKSLQSDLDRQAIISVRSWRFKPSRKDGKPVTAWNTVEIAFRLE